MNKKILLVSWHFPPFKSSSSFNLFKRLKDTGYEFDVLQIKRSEAPDNLGMFAFSSSKFNRYEIDVPSENSRDTLARSIFVEKALAIHRHLRTSNHYSAMLSHSHELASHIAAMAIKNLNPELRWIASFGDPIAANPFNKSYNFPLLAEDCLVETEVIKTADRVVVTNSYQRDEMVASQGTPAYRDKFFILPHCFDSRMYSDNPAEPKCSSDSAVFRFMHVGMLYKFKRTSEPFLLATQLLLRNHPELRGKVSVEFYGASDQYVKAAADYGLADIVSFKGTVSYLESLRIMKRADCLLLRDADFSDDGLTATPFYPGKLADYLGAAKPVLAVSMDRGCVPDMLAMIGGAVLNEKDIAGLADSMYGAIKGDLSFNVAEAARYSHAEIAQVARDALTFRSDKKKILFAGHDLKFAKFMLDAIAQNENLELLIDHWDGHDRHDEERSIDLLNQADTIFCEWGLGNLEWYSNRKKRGQKLITRIHAQELNTPYLRRANHDNIDNYIFVSPYYYELMVARFSLDRGKCRIIFNMVDTVALDKAKTPEANFHIGMIGDVPYSKRLDRALDIFGELHSRDSRYKLFVKGKRPEEYAWMHTKSREGEMAYYREQYRRIKDEGWSNSVFFDGYGPIDEWLSNIGWIISVSESESFHLAAAEGMASGAVPAILKWPGSEYIYPAEHIHETIKDLCRSIENTSSDTADRVKSYASRFDKHTILPKFISML